MLLDAGDEHAQVALQVYAVDEHDAVDLVHDVRHRADRPEPGRRPAEAAVLARHVELAPLAEMPRQEGLQLAGRDVVAVGRSGPARTAPPALLPALVLPFLFIGRPQDRHFFSFIHASAKKMTFHGLHSAWPEETMRSGNTFCPGRKVDVFDFLARNKGIELRQCPYWRHTVCPITLESSWSCQGKTKRILSE